MNKAVIRQFDNRDYNGKPSSTIITQNNDGNKEQVRFAELIRRVLRDVKTPAANKLESGKKHIHIT